MGFIDRLGEQMQRKKDEEMAKWKPLSQNDQKAPPVEEEIDNIGKSIEYYENSGCDSLIKSLNKLVEGRIDVGKYYFSAVNPDTTQIIEEFGFRLLRGTHTGWGNFIVFLTWGYGSSSLRCISIETCPTGDIYLHGSKTSVVKQDQWRIGTESLDKALEKTFFNPKKKATHYNNTPESRGWNS